jgi:hypothetical protein
MTQDEQRALAAKRSMEAQERAKRENELNELNEFERWRAKADQLKRCVDMAPSHLERLFYQKHLSAHLRSAIAKATGDTP